jgi:ADP-glucose pyrophosphorylase
MQTVLGIILGGGAGSRLYPLTKKRAKPAVPLGANYRLIDIPVSNCINSGAELTELCGSLLPKWRLLLGWLKSSR